MTFYQGPLSSATGDAAIRLSALTGSITQDSHVLTDTKTLSVEAREASYHNVVVRMNESSAGTRWEFSLDNNVFSNEVTIPEVAPYDTVVVYVRAEVINDGSLQNSLTYTSALELYSDELPSYVYDTQLVVTVESYSYIQEKNELQSQSVFLVMLEIAIPGQTGSVYIVANTENITWAGHEWVAFPFELDAIDENAGGDLPTFNIKVSNADRVFDQYLMAYDTWLKLNYHETISVTLSIVNSYNLQVDTPEVSYAVDVLSYQLNQEWATFTLGPPNLYNYVFPKDSYQANSCRWTFKSSECGYTGSADSCDKTLQACKDKGGIQSERFGGFYSIENKIHAVLKV